MRVEVVERIPEFRAADAQATEDPSVKLALKNFQNAIQSDDSFFDNHGKGMGPIVAEGDGNATCGGSFLVTFRDEKLVRNQGLYFQLIQKLTELLKEAGSQNVLAASICLISAEQKEVPKGTLGLKIHLEAKGDSSEQASLRWGLGLAHLQQALLFISRYLRQQVSGKKE